MATVLLYSPSAHAFFAIVIDHKISIRWDDVIYAAAGQTILFFLMAYGLGLGVLKKGWNVNYTRKILQIGVFLVPFLLIMPNVLLVDVEEIRGKALESDIHFSNAFPVYIFTGLVVMFWTYLFSDQWRRKCKFFAVSFAAIDRPEDEGLTLRWLRTEIVAVYALLAACNLIYIPLFYSLFSEILMLAVIVSSMGDGLAGIIGTKYGRHPYKVKALFTNKIYTRTWEGSFCIYAVTFVTILCAWIFYGELGIFYFPLLLVVPVATAYAEAKSPHSWDNPFIVCAIIISSWLTLLLSFGLIRGAFLIANMFK